MSKYYILSLFLGIIHKLYDDLFDNNLYEYFNIKKSKIKYVNELLKCLFILGYAVLSLRFLYFYIFFSLINAVLYFIKKDEYGPYEFSGILSSIILLPFLNWGENSEYKQNIIYISCLFIGCFILEKKCNIINCEYSYTKLFFRTVTLIIFILLLILNNKFNIFSKTIIVICLFNIGYLLTSCIFQYILLQKNKEIQCANTDKKPGKKSGKKPKKTKKNLTN